MKQLEVQIMGQGYLLSCPEGGQARLLEAVQQVDAAMCKIRDAGKIKARDRIAVLAALNLAFELVDRQTAPAAAPAAETPAATAAQTASGGSGSGNSAGNATAADLIDDIQLTRLLQRLDQALGKDGQLL